MSLSLISVLTYDGNSGGDVCHFPFIYKSETYEQCIDAESDVPWCSTTPHYDNDVTWGKCTGIYIHSL